MIFRHAVGLAALLSALSPAAFAVNYPTELTILVQGSDPAKPTLLIGFNNNEGDRVRFNYEIKVNGVLWPQAGVDDVIRCVANSANGDDCKGAAKRNLRDPWSPQKGWRAVVMGPVNIDTEYCFRVIAIGYNGGNSAWTPWGCVITPGLPRRPTTPPPTPTLTLLDAGSDGKGKPGGATPGKVLVEWVGNAPDAVWFSVERAPAIARSQWVEVGRVTPVQGASTDLEIIDTIADLNTVPSVVKPLDYRVCSNNAGGKICSSPRQFPRLAAELTTQSSRAKVLMGSNRPTVLGTNLKAPQPLAPTSITTPSATTPSIGVRTALPGGLAASASKPALDWSRVAR